MKTVWIVLGVIVLGVLMLGGSLMSSRNELVTDREAYKAAYQQVDVDLQRRLDLIPNLVETVKGFAKQEQNVIDSVTKARAAMMGAQSPADRIAARYACHGEDIRIDAMFIVPFRLPRHLQNIWHG